MRTTFIAALCLAAVGFSSCLGASADISIRANGSGIIALEYRVSQMLESMGRLDGNERWPAIPVGKADFERGVAGIPGLRLTRFSAKEVRGKNGGKDLLTNVTLEFSETKALLAFLDGTGGRSSYNANGGNALRLDLLDPAPHNADLVSLLREVSDGYEIGISLSAPKSATLSVLPHAVPAAKVVSRGKKVSFAIGLADLLDLREGLALEIQWQ